MSEFEQLHNKAIGFFDGKVDKNNVVNFIKHHAENNPDGVAFVWADPAKLPTWGEKAFALVQLKEEASPRQGAVLKEPGSQLRGAGIPFDHLGVFDNIPMDSRHHSKVEYGVLRAGLLAKK